MDRRRIAGVVALALVGSAPSAWGMQQKDPSSVGTVGYTPLDPITERINTNAVAQWVTPGATVPTDPTASGPQARVPTPPVGPNPVGFNFEPPLDQAVDQGYPTSGFGWFTRRNPKAAAARSQTPRSKTVAPVDPATIPSRLTWDDSGQVPSSMNGTTATIGGASTARPAPYAGQTPELPRRQALAPPPDDADGTAVIGRPAPLHADVPRQARRKVIQDPAATAPKPRPRAGATINPRTAPPAGPAPVIPSTLPGRETIEPAGMSPVSLPPLEPAVLPPLGAQSSGGDRPAEPAPLVAAAVMADPLPEPPPQLTPTLPTGPDAAVVPTVTELGPPPPGMPSDLPALTANPLIPAVAPAATAAPVAPGTARAAEPVVASLATDQEPNQMRADPALVRTSGDPTAMRIEPLRPREAHRPYASARAAAVGDEVITVHQVQTMVAEKYKAMTAGQQLTETEKHDLINTLGSMALDHLIEQSLVLQEAKHKFKNPKMKQQFDDFANKRWREEKLPPLLLKTATTNEYELKRKLAEEGQSYDEMMENYRRDLLEHDFLYNEIKNKINGDLVDLKAYYNENLHDYDHPARIDWREIEVNVAKYPDRAAARRQADAIRARLAHKEDFAAVAQGSSDGPTAIKGGLYAEMTPGSYGIPSVNDVLNTIPIGQISPVIEAPMSFHIVRVESRRAAGPLRFDEVQKKVAEAVFERNLTKARDEYIAKLRKKTLVRVMPIFQKPQDEQYSPSRGDNSLSPASNR